MSCFSCTAFQYLHLSRKVEHLEECEPLIIYTNVMTLMKVHLAWIFSPWIKKAILNDVLDAKMAPAARLPVRQLARCEHAVSWQFISQCYGFI